MNGTPPLTIFELADRLGRYRFIELALFGIVGESARRADDASLCVALSEASHAHAYRADLVERRLLVSVGLPNVTESTRSPSHQHSELLTSLGEIDPVELVRHLSSVWYPMMVDAYQVHLNDCADTSNGPTRRMLGRIAYDLDVSQAEIGRHVRDGGDAFEVDSARHAIDAIGGPFGTRGL